MTDNKTKYIKPIISIVTFVVLAIILMFLSIGLLSNAEPLNIEEVSTWAELRAAVADNTVNKIVLLKGINLQAGDVGNVINIPAGREVLITSNDGNIHSIFREFGNQRHFTVNGTLRLENVELNGRYPYDASGHGGVQVSAGGHLIMGDGSAIRNNRNINSSQGGAITVTGAGAAFTMNGGEISGNSAFTATVTQGVVGGVFVQNGAVFTMNGGVIYNNVGRLGGGVTINSALSFAVADTQFIMNGGEIRYNTSTLGGAVNVERGTFTMNDGTIQKNTATALGNPPSTTIQGNRGGGGVFLQNGGIFDMAGGTIDGNISDNHGGGVMLLPGTAFNMTGGTISNNIAANNGGGVAAALVNGAGNAAPGVITLSMTSATLKDDTVTYGTITGNTATNGGGVWLTPGSDTASGSQLTMTDGIINGNTAENNGGGIWLGTGNATSGARLNMTDGTISGNTAENGYGGGIFTSSFVYSDPLPNNAYSNILAAQGIFSGNFAGTGRFLPPSNHDILSFGELFTNYDINYVQGTRVITVTFQPGANGTLAKGTPNVVILVPYNTALEAEDIPSITANNGWTHVGWTLNGINTVPLGFTAVESVTFIAQYTPVIVTPAYVTVTFQPGANGALQNGTPNITLTLPQGTVLNSSHIPLVTANTGWTHSAWTLNGINTVPLGFAVVENVTFIAQYTPVIVTPVYVTVTFEPGAKGALQNGTPNITLTLPQGTVLNSSHIPTVNPNTGWTHSGWMLSEVAINSLGIVVNENITFIAVYDEVVTPSTQLPPSPETGTINFIFGLAIVLLFGGMIFVMIKRRNYTV